MRISFLLSSLQLSGGVQVVIEYANRLSARGHAVALVAPGGASDPMMSDQVAPGVTLCTSRVERQGPAVPTTLGLARMAHLAWSMARAVPASDIVVATHTPTTAVSLLACQVMRRGRPVWLFMDYPEMFAGRPYELWLMRHAQRWHRHVLTLSRDSQREVGVKEGTIVGLGLSHPELLRPVSTQARRTEQEKKCVLYLGDTRPRKGLADLLAAAELAYQRIEPFELWIASKEPCAIEGKVPVRLIRQPTRGELAQLYATCDLFVSASWREGFGLPPLEAMACGAPVVLTDSGGVREYASHGENCLMVPPRDPQALAAAMVRVLTDAALAGQLRREGPRTAAQFTWKSAVDRFEGALERVAREEHRAGDE
jgi:glycosyltransferase involved in cell wall biosynthesis